MADAGEELQVVVSRLERVGCVAAQEEAEELVAGAGDASMLEAWVARREQGEPLAWITGRMRFCDRDLIVAPGVYVPRRQSEELARRAASLAARGAAVLDLCTGSGAIGATITALVPGSRVLGVDVEPEAARCARRNGLPSVVGDLTEPFVGGPFFDLVTVVAPYVPTDDLRFLPSDVQRYEPRLALEGGPEGLDILRRVIEGVPRVLRRGGWLLVEVGGEQDVALASDLEAAGFEDATFWRDEEGDLRGLAGRLR